MSYLPAPVYVPAMIRLQTALVASCIVAAAPAYAHFKLNSPPSRSEQDGLGGPQKSSPCGLSDVTQGSDDSTPTNIVAELKAGGTVTVTINDREAATSQLRENVVPAVSQAPGFVAGYWTRGDDGGLSMETGTFAVDQDTRIDTVLLGCTHYALIEDSIRNVVPAEIRVVSQGAIVAEKLADYLGRHPEFGESMDLSGETTFLTTKYSESMKTLATRFYGSAIMMETIAR